MTYERDEVCASTTDTTPLLAQTFHGARTEAETVKTGKSTLSQTIFNSVNALVGIAILSIPYAFKSSGMVLGSLFMTASYFSTMTAAKNLGSILQKRQHLRTYADIAGFAFGPRFKAFVTALFYMGMSGALVSLSLLFSSSFGSLISVPENHLKVFIFVVMFFLTLLPLNYLSFTSLLGIVTVFTMVAMIFACGFSTNLQPGSLVNPMPVNIWPSGTSKTKDVMLSLGMFMAPWGGHPVFPELFRDMKHKHRYSQSCSISFSFAFSLYYTIGLFAILMYGQECQDFLMTNLLQNHNYPTFFRPVFMLLMGIIPVSKMPLIARPLISTYESFFGINDTEPQNRTLIVKQMSLRAVFVSVLLAVSLSVSSFGKVVAFIGSTDCFLLCLVLPLWFKLKILRNELSALEVLWLKTGVVLGVVLGVLGTIGVVIS